jgi:hypothetical protein
MLSSGAQRLKVTWLGLVRSVEGQSKRIMLFAKKNSKISSVSWAPKLSDISTRVLPIPGCQPQISKPGEASHTAYDLSSNTQDNTCALDVTYISNTANICSF